MTFARSMDGKGDTFLIGQNPPGAPKGIIDAISEIQQYYVVEKNGSPIPEEFLTFKGKLTFFQVGFKTGLLSGFVTALLSPFAIAVMEHLIPVFGTYRPTLFDQFFAFLLSISFAVGFGVLIAMCGKYYIGGLSRTAIKNLVGGVVSGALLKLFFVFILFHSLYVVLTPTRVYNLISHFGLSELKTYSVYMWVMKFKPLLLTASYFVAFTTFLFIAIPIVAIAVGARRSKRNIERQEEWV